MDGETRQIFNSLRREIDDLRGQVAKLESRSAPPSYTGPIIFDGEGIDAEYTYFARLPLEQIGIGRIGYGAGYKRTWLLIPEPLGYTVNLELDPTKDPINEIRYCLPRVIDFLNKSITWAGPLLYDAKSDPDPLVDDLTCPGAVEGDLQLFRHNPYLRPGDPGYDPGINNDPPNYYRNHQPNTTVPGNLYMIIVRGQWNERLVFASELENDCFIRNNPA